MPLLILVIVFGVVIFLNLRNVMLGVSLLSAAVLALVLQGKLNLAPAVLLHTLTDPTTLNLLISINLIQILGELLQRAGVLNRLVDRLYGLLGNARLILMLIPMMMALIPGPGVILLSAPILAEAAKKANLDSTEKGYINYWFRTSIQTSSPLTFAFLLATSMVTVDKLKFFVNLFPFTLVMLLTGYYLQIRKIPVSGGYEKEKVKTPGSHLKLIFPLLKDLVFIWIVLVLYLGLELSFAVSVSCSILWVIVSEKIHKEDVFESIKKGVSLNLTLMILGVMYFSDVIDASKLMDEVIAWSSGLGIPILLLVTILPFVIGVVIGTYAGSTALVFSLLGNISYSVPYLVMLYILSRIGNYLSPINSSVLLCKLYFAGSNRIHQKIAVSVLPVAAYLLVYLAATKFNLGL